MLDKINSFRSIPAKNYAPKNAFPITDRGHPIDVDKENKMVSQYLQFLKANNTLQNLHTLLIPGFANNRTIEISNKGIQSLSKALKAFHQHPITFLMVSGGNVSPPGTPYNESMEMKRWLLEKGVPEYQIAIEPYAQNSVDNLEYAKSFLISHEIDQATVVTWLIHNIYFGFPHLSSFHLRSYYLKRHKVGELNIKSCFNSCFRPRK